jgi:Chaperone for flagella basal body P-ring formation
MSIDIGHKFRVVCLSLIVSASTLSAGEVMRYHVGEQDIRRLLLLPDSEVRVSLPMITSGVNAPQLRVLAIAHLGREVQVRIRCQRRTDCGDFFVALQFTGTRQAQEFLQSYAITVARHETPTKIAIKAGTCVELHIASRTVSLKIKVSALQSGRAGQTIRVRDELTRRIYSGYVESGGGLRADL